MTGNRKVGQYEFLLKYRSKIPVFDHIVKELDKYFDKAKDFGEMYEFLTIQQLGNGSIFQPEALKDLDIWCMTANWWLWKHSLKLSCYYCKYWAHTKYVYGTCYDNDMEKCQRDTDLIWQVKRIVEVEE